MPLTPVTHKPSAAQARQFDGTYDAVLDILNARSSANVTVTLSYDDDGALATMTLVGGLGGGSLRLNIDDWAIFPEDINEPAFALDNARALQLWQA